MEKKLIKNEFDVLVDAVKNCLVVNDENNDVIKASIEKKWITNDLKITDIGKSLLQPYKVDNAVIMAAGLSSRCLPLSNILPKGLFRVKGEILIEREIEQLRAAGIEEIVLVVGYLKEKFEYLRDKYNVIIVDNDEYRIRNNTSSIMAAKNYMKNTYVCCADNYFTENIFESYVYDSYYTCKYTKEYLDEFCLTKIENGYIKEIIRGGKDCYYTMGAVFFSKSFSDKFMELLIKEYQNDEVKNMLIDTFHLIHIDELPSMYKGYSDDVIKEFDTLKEFSEFDSSFIGFYNEQMSNRLFERYSTITRYNGVPTEWVTGRLHYNENLFGPSPKCIDTLYETRVEDLYLYDASKDDELIETIENDLGISKQNLFLHNGSAESIKSIFSIVLKEGDTVLLPNPGWSYYSGLVDYKFGKKVFYSVDEGEKKCKHNVDDILEKAKKYAPKLIIVTSPAMPTGNMISFEDLEIIVKNNPGTIIVVDEAYYGFTKYEIDVKYLVEKYNNIVFSRTFSKYYGLANMRIGYGIASQEVMRALWLDLPLHKLPHIARRMAVAAIEDKAYYEEITNEIVHTREWFIRELNMIDGVKAFQSDSNFVYLSINICDVEKLKEYMKENGFLIRVFDDGTKKHLRITIAQKEIMEDCLNKLKLGMKIC